MKNRFIQMFLVICAVMLIICTVSVWAAAEDVTATPTDLMPVEPAESVSETEMSDEEDKARSPEAGHRSCTTGEPGCAGSACLDHG